MPSRPYQPSYAEESEWDMDLHIGTQYRDVKPEREAVPSNEIEIRDELSPVWFISDRPKVAEIAALAFSPVYAGCNHR